MRIVQGMVLACLLAAASAWGAEGDAALRTVTVAGSGLIEVDPDQATLEFGVESFAQDLDAAKSENEKASANALKALSGLGIESGEIHTQNLEVEPVYKDEKRPSKGVDGYFARRSYHVTLKDLKKLDDLVKAVLSGGANKLYSLQPRFSDPESLREKAILKALETARRKAKLMATTLDAALGRVRTIEEGAAIAANPFSASGGSDSLILGKVRFEYDVTVTFDLN